MKTRLTIAVSMLAGAVVGGAAIQALHAQAKPPVYMIAINEVSDQERYAKEYVSPAQKSVKDHGGEYLAAGPGTRVAGNLPEGPVVILRWESMEALQAWRNSPEFQAALKIGENYKLGAIHPNFRLHSRLARNTRNLTSSPLMA